MSTIDEDSLYPPISMPVESEMEEDGTDPEDSDSGGDERRAHSTDSGDDSDAPTMHSSFGRTAPLPRTTLRHHDPLMATAHHAINNAVIEPHALSTGARTLLLERQKSEHIMREKRGQQQQSVSFATAPDSPIAAPAHHGVSFAPVTTPLASPSGKRGKRPTDTPRDPLHPPPPESLSVFRLTALNQLLKTHARRGNFIMLDLDETLVITKHQPALLLSSYGVRMFQSYVRSAFSDFATKNRLCRQLESALKDKVLVESDTAIVIAQLQKAGCWVFGVTARYPELATNTQRTLLSLGISLGSSAPFPSTVIKDPVTDAVFSDGVIYCGRESKAKVVSRFLENVVFAQLLQRAQQEARLAEEQLRAAAEAEAAAEELELQATPMPTPMRASSYQASPSMVSVGPDTPMSSGSPYSSSPQSPSSSANTPYTDGGFMTPGPTVSMRRMPSMSEMTPLPIDRVLRQRPNRSPLSPEMRTSAATSGYDSASGLTQTPLARSVSSPATVTSFADRLSLQPEMTPTHAQSAAHAHAEAQANATASALYRSASVARAMATPLFSATRAARHRSRRTSKLPPELHEAKTPAKTPSAMRRAMSSAPLFSPVVPPPLSLSTISKRQRQTKATPLKQRATGLQRSKRRIQVKARVPRSALPPEVIFVDNEVQHVAEMQAGLTIAKKLKIPLRCYCFAPTTQLELQQQQEERDLFTDLIAEEHKTEDEKENGEVSNATSALAAMPMPSAQDSAIASALSLHSLSASSHTVNSSMGSTSATSASAGGGAGIYGFMLALGNVLPSSAVSTSSVPTPTSAPPATPTPTHRSTLSGSSSTSAQVVSPLGLMSHEEVDEDALEADAEDDTDADSAAEGELIEEEDEETNSRALVNDSTQHAQLYDEDDGASDEATDAAEAADVVAQTEDDDELPAAASSCSGLPPRASSLRRPIRGDITSATDDTADETETETGNDGTTTEYQTEYTDATEGDTQTSATETDGAESDAVAMTRSLGPSSVRPMLMPSTKQRAPAQHAPIDGLSTTESLEVAAAALGAESAAVLQVQMATFAASGVILSNQEALEHLRRQEEESDEETEEDEDEETEDEEEDEESEDEDA